jgi:pyruvate dehydrogenase (quinone)
MQMNGMAELLTIKKYWKDWADPRLVVLVLHNNDLNQVTWEQRVMEGDPKFEATQVLPDMDYAGYAELIGLKGVRIERKEDIVPALEAAFAADRPCVIDAHTDPEVPPLPPHVTWKQAVGIVSALLKGDPESGDIIRHSFKGKIKEFLPA